MFSTVLFTLFVLPCVDPAFMNKLAGPYDIIVKQISTCGNFAVKTYDSTKLSKYNRTTFVYSTNVYLPYGITDDMQFDVEAAVFGNGGWKENYLQVSKDRMCSSVKLLMGKTIEDLFSAMGVVDCPLAPGNYTLKNYVFRVTTSFPVMPYNKYRVDGFFKHKNKRYSCGRVYADVVPKKKFSKHLY